MYEYYITDTFWPTTRIQATSLPNKKLDKQLLRTPSEKLQLVKPQTNKHANQPSHTDTASNSLTKIIISPLFSVQLLQSLRES